MYRILIAFCHEFHDACSLPAARRRLLLLELNPDLNLDLHVDPDLDRFLQLAYFWHICLRECGESARNATQQPCCGQMTTKSCLFCSLVCGLDTRRKGC